MFTFILNITHSLTFHLNFSPEYVHKFTADSCKESDEISLNLDSAIIVTADPVSNSIETCLPFRFTVTNRGSVLAFTPFVQWIVNNESSTLSSEGDCSVTTCVGNYIFEIKELKEIPFLLWHTLAKCPVLLHLLRTVSLCRYWGALWLV